MKNLRNSLILFFYFFISCSMFSILPSDTRGDQQNTLEISNDLFISSVGPVEINKSKFIPASTIIESEELKIFIDPVAVQFPEPADLILISHGHGDHFSLPDIERLNSSRTIILAPKQLSEKLRRNGIPCESVTPGDTILVDDVMVEVIWSYNIQNAFLFLKAHPKKSNNVGYVVNLPDGTRILFPGDSSNIPEFKTLKNIDIILLPLGDGTLTMNIQEALELINDLSPSIVVPVHYLLKHRNTIADLKNRLPPETSLVLIE